MNRQVLQTLASDWTRMAKNDIRNKVIEFMNEVNTNPQELAYALTISEGELQQILEGNGEITLSTFAKLLIATGNALEIKPIEETPLGCYQNMPPEEPRPAMHFGRENRETMAPDMPFGRPPFPPHRPLDFDDHFGTDEDEFGSIFARRNRDTRENARPTQHATTQRAPQSKFRMMERPQLVEIINNNLWESEIDINHSSTEDLMSFLEEKDKRINEIKRARENNADPAVIRFKERINESLKSNPHLREYLKNLLND